MKKASEIFKKKSASSKKEKAEKKKAAKKEPVVKLEPPSVAKSEFEIITDNIIYETIGPNGSMTVRLNEFLNSYEADSNPIGVDVTKKIIKALISDAVCQRSRISETFITAVNEGEITTKYYDKIKVIQNQEAKANAAVTDAAFISAEAQKARDRYALLSNDEFEKRKNKFKKDSNENK